MLFRSTGGILNVVLNAQDGDDTFNVAGSQAYAGITVSGGDPTTSDTLNFTGDGVNPVTLNLGTQTVGETGFAAVAFPGVELLNINAGANALTVTGTSGQDNITYRPTAVNDGVLTRAGQNLVTTFTNVVTAFTVDTIGGEDAVTVLGTSTADTFTVVKGATSTVQVNAFKTVNLLSATVENVTLLSGDGNDTINISGTTINGQIFAVDAGNPDANSGSDTLTITMATADRKSVV